MAPDESFKRPGAVPFKWEIQPGVPNPQHNQRSASIERSPTLRPPPAAAGNYDYPRPELGSFSDQSTSRSRSNRVRIDRQSSEEVSTGSMGCFPTLLTRKGDKKRNGETEPEVDYNSDPETLAAWSTSPRKTFSASVSFSCFGSPTRFMSSPKIGRERQVGSVHPLLEREGI